MPLVSVKLLESTKPRVAQVALSRGSTAHAVMVRAIESAVESAQTYDSFVADALAARDAVYQAGKVYDGAEFTAYLRGVVRAKVRAKAPAKAGDEALAKPRMKSPKCYLKASA